MSFESSITELVKLGATTLESATKACGENDGLTQTIVALRKVSSKLQREVLHSSSPINRAKHERRNDLREHMVGCTSLLRVISSVLVKYNAQSPEKQKEKQLWSRVRFRNGEVRHMAEIRKELSTHTTAIVIGISLCSLSSMGKAEAKLRRVEKHSAEHEYQMPGIRRSLQWATASILNSAGHRSKGTSYTIDDEGNWRKLRRELEREGYHCLAIKRYKSVIIAYDEELRNYLAIDWLHDENTTYTQWLSAHPAGQDHCDLKSATETTPTEPTHSEKSHASQMGREHNPGVGIEEVLDEEFLPSNKDRSDGEWLLENPMRQEPEESSTTANKKAAISKSENKGKEALDSPSHNGIQSENDRDTSRVVKSKDIFEVQRGSEPKPQVFAVDVADDVSTKPLRPRLSNQHRQRRKSSASKHVHFAEGEKLSKPTTGVSRLSGLIGVSKILPGTHWGS